MSAEQAHGGRELDNPTPHHEESDVHARGIVAFAVALAVVALVLHIAVWLLLRYYEREAEVVRPDYPVAVSQQPQMPAMPRLQTNPRQDLRDLRTQEDAILGSYGWFDRNAGAVRIPIDEAMKLTVERGLPARSGQAPAAATSTGDANSGRMVGAVK